MALVIQAFVLSEALETLKIFLFAERMVNNDINLVDFSKKALGLLYST